MALAYSALWRGFGMVLGNFIYLGWRMKREQIALRPTFIKVRELASLMPFTFFSQSSGVVASNLDAFLTAHFLGAELVPVIVLSRKAFDICRMIISRPVMAITPALTHLIGEEGLDRARDLLTRLTYIMVWGMFLVVGGLLSLNEVFVHFWVGTNLYVGDDINYLLCLGFILTVLTSSLSFVLVALGHIKSTTAATLLQSMVLMLTLVIGTKYFGLIGLVSAPIISMGLVGAWYFPRLFIRVLSLGQNKRYLIFRELINSLLTAAIVSSGFMFFEASSLMVFAIQVFLFIIVYCFILGFLSRVFRSECINFYRSFSIKQSSY
jgi:O-antigen/teichoic acid export membrane protein